MKLKFLISCLFASLFFQVANAQTDCITSAIPVSSQSKTICVSENAPLLNTDAVGTLTPNEIGVWSAIGPCTITPTGQTSNLQIGDNVFKYTITTTVPGCSPSVGTVTIRVVASPTASIIAPIAIGNNATSNTTRRDLTIPYQAVAGTPSTGYSGSWSVSGAGAATFSGYVADFTSIGNFEDQTTLIWTVKDNDNICPAASSTLIITRTAFVIEPISDDSICASQTSTVIKGNPKQPSGETATWTALDGGTIVMNSDQSEITVTNLPPFAGNSATFRFEYSITNTILVPNVTTKDIATLKVYAVPSKTDAGLDDTTCANMFQLNASYPVVGSGKWSAISKSIVFDDVTKADAIAGNLPNALNSNFVPITFIWTVSNGLCPSVQDTVIIAKRGETTEPIARVDHSSVCAGATIKLIGNKPAADESGQWNMNAVAIGPNKQDTVEYKIPTNYSGKLSFYYDIRSKWCAPRTSNIVMVNVLNNPTIAQNILADVKDCSSLPMVSGIVFADLNKNGIKDANEPVKPNTKITIQPSGFYTFTDNSGYYEFLVSGVGMYVLEVDETYSSSAFAKSIVFSALGENLSQDLALDIVKPTKDLRISLTSYNIPRPGFDDVIYVTVENRSNVSSEAVLTFTAPSKFSVTSSTGLGTTLDNLTWNLGTLRPYQFVWGTINGKISTTASIGDTLSFSSTVNPNDQDDINLANNISKLNLLVRGSYDPNDKQGPGAISPAQVAAAEELDYTVRFQNTGNDTAFTVVIADTLSTNVDASSLEFVSSSHPCKTSVLGNTAYFEFKKILLPDSNINEKASHGFVRYTVKPKNSLVVGNTILSSAAIYFDYNSPVFTNTVSTIVLEPITSGIETTDYDLGTIAVYPNPAKESLYIRMSESMNEVQFELLNINGQSILKQRLTKKQSQVDISGLNSGSYLYRVSTPDNVKYGKLMRE